ncbi:Outer membrane protein TolC [Ekhidna lutea]|uniref:Outer membrane protein TolC n=1 Tax=Ekhidna lutea TaxID=447679 RepID=A0A239J9G5_EKHLU|nr:TolC family protein [Ekhidna lutea]SNT02480.1 Outer membrane protein TolC [Ekhidna lutea]
MRKFIFGIILFASLTIAAQEAQELSLDDCISIAMEKNIDLKRARNNEISARANRFQAIMNFFPSLTAGINYDYFFGNFFDQNAARQVSATTNSSNPNLSSSVIIFNGFSNQYNLKQRESEQRAAEAAVDNAQLSVKSNIMTFYLNAVLSQENLRIAEDRVRLLESQLEREEKRVSVGVGNLDAVYNLRSQLSNEKQNLISAKNTLATNELTLIQAMQLDPSDNYIIKPTSIQEEELLTEIDPFDLVLSDALKINPAIDQAGANKDAANYSYKRTSAGQFPTLSAFGRIGSNYSSNGARNPETGDFEPNATFSDQLDFNKFEYVNFQLNIPIFNRFQTRRDIQVARVGVLNAELDFQQAQNSVTNLVQRVYLDMLNAQTTYQSAKENLEAQQSIFDFIKKRFETGNTDFNTYQESLTNKNRAELQLVNAKYSIVFRKQILELFRGE